MEYYGDPSHVVGYASVSISSGDWRRQQQQQQHHHHHGGSSSSSVAGTAETGLEERFWRMTVQPEEMDGGPASYPERPGEPDCVYYMRTGLCGFGMSCRFNHPSNANLAAALAQGRGGEYPERPGQPDCQYFLKTGTCKFGATCKYHHPSDKARSIGRVQINVQGFPLRPEEKDCAYYMRTGSCKYGVTCKFHHPQPAAMGSLVSMSGSPLYATAATQSSSIPQPYPAGIPSWPIARAPYLQAPSSFAPLIIPPPQGVVSMTGWNSYQGPVNDLSTPEGQQHSLGTRFPYGGLEMDAVSGYAPYVQGSSAMGLPVLQPQPIHIHKETIFPERPGQPECQYYVKTGDCKFGATCRYHHPKDRTTPTPTCVLNPLGLPLRPGAQPCTFYTHYGICKFGPTCKFDHPLRSLTYGSSASLLTDIPVHPYPIGSLLTALTPLSSSEVPQEVSNTTSPSNEPASEELSGHISLRDIPDSAVVSTMAAANTSQNLLAQGTSSEMAISNPAELTT